MKQLMILAVAVLALAACKKKEQEGGPSMATPQSTPPEVKAAAEATCKKLEELAKKEGGAALDKWNALKPPGDCVRELQSEGAKSMPDLDKIGKCVEGKATYTEAVQCAPNTLLAK